MKPIHYQIIIAGLAGTLLFTTVILSADNKSHAYETEIRYLEDYICELQRELGYYKCIVGGEIIEPTDEYFAKEYCQLQFDMGHKQCKFANGTTIAKLP